MPASLKVVPLRFEFRAVDIVRIPPGKAGNVFRGGFGTVLREIGNTAERSGESPYTALFEPRSAHGPSGFAMAPRPFVIRARSLDGKTFHPGDRFSVHVHLFGDPVPDAPGWIRRVLARLAESGLGVGRGRAELAASATGDPLLLCIDTYPGGARRFAIDFLTPTDLKAQGAAGAEPEFQVVFARARDRISSLMALYGTSSPVADFRALGEAARSVRMVVSDLRRVQTERRSSRTGQTHGIGGLIGRAEYEGDLGPFLGWLKGAYWTGVGRHTVWGNGVIRVTENR